MTDHKIMMNGLGQFSVRTIYWDGSSEVSELFATGEAAAEFIAREKALEVEAYENSIYADD